MENLFSTIFRALVLMEILFLGLPSNPKITAWRDSTSPYFTSTPVWKGSIASLAPPTSEATTGVPAAMDSRMTLENPSLEDGNTVLNMAHSLK